MKVAILPTLGFSIIYTAFSQSQTQVKLILDVIQGYLLTAYADISSDALLIWRC